MRKQKIKLIIDMFVNFECEKKDVNYAVFNCIMQVVKTFKIKDGVELEIYDRISKLRNLYNASKDINSNIAKLELEIEYFLDHLK